MLKRLFDLLVALLDFIQGRTEFERRTTGAAAISDTLNVSDYAKGKRAELISVEVHFSAAPTTSESFTVTLTSHLGTPYNVVLFSNNPSLEAATDIVNIWDKPYPLDADDQLVVAYTNTDANRVGVRLVGRVR